MQLSQTCDDCGHQLDDVHEGASCQGCGSHRRDVEVEAPTAEAHAMAMRVTVWQTYHFAPEWLSDAKEQARLVDNHNARRREVVFAVCFAESYLFEFVRDSILGTDFQRVSEFFPPSHHVGIRERWKEVVGKLNDGGFLITMPPTGDKHDQEWDRLVSYRDGIVHARSSRPQTNPQPEAEQPIPSKSALDRLAPGWAARVVIERAGRLHLASGKAVPPWLTS
jgi:hypothetical protein